jgi:hypothetical protein
MLKIEKINTFSNFYWDGDYYTKADYIDVFTDINSNIIISRIINNKPFGIILKIN